jgi:hypothetical protein
MSKDNRYNQKNVEKIVSDVVVEAIETGTPEEFWLTIDSLLSIAAASVAYRFGEDSRGEVVEHMVSIVIDTYDTQKYFHVKENDGKKPKFH